MKQQKMNNSFLISKSINNLRILQGILVRFLCRTHTLTFATRYTIKFKVQMALLLLIDQKLFKSIIHLMHTFQINLSKDQNYTIRLSD